MYAGMDGITRWIMMKVVARIAMGVGLMGSWCLADGPRALVLEKMGAERKLPEKMLGASAEAMIEHLIDDPAKVAALKEMKLGVVRFPGGSQSNYYDWRKGQLDVEATLRPRSAWSRAMRRWRRRSSGQSKKMLCDHNWRKSARCSSQRPSTRTTGRGFQRRRRGRRVWVEKS